MADSFNGSYRGEHVDGPLICVRNFTDAGAASRTMPMASLSVYNGVDGYDEVTSTEPLPIVLRDSNGNEPIVPRLTLSDTMSYSTAGIIGATLIGYNSVDSQWNRIYVSDDYAGHLLTTNPSVRENGEGFSGGEPLTLIGFGNSSVINTVSTDNRLPTKEKSTLEVGTSTPSPLDVTVFGYANNGTIYGVNDTDRLPVKTYAEFPAETSMAGGHGVDIIAYVRDDSGTPRATATTETNRLPVKTNSQYFNGESLNGSQNVDVIAYVNSGTAAATSVSTNDPLPAKMYAGSSTAAVDNGASDSSTLRVTIANDSTGTISAYRNDVTAQNSFTASTNAQTFTSVGGYNTALVQITGTWTGTITFQGSVDGSTFFTIPAVSIDSSGVIVDNTTANGNWLLNISGLEKVRIYATTISSGTAVVDTHLSIGSNGVTLVHPLPTGTNTIGAVNIAAAQTLATVTNLAQLGGTAIAMGTGTRSSGTQRVTIATDDIVLVSGTIAHDSPDSNNPLKIGGKASTTLPTAVSTTGDRVDAAFDRHGYQIVRSGGQAVNAWSKQHTPSSNTQATIAQSAAGSGLKNICTSITATLACGSTAPTANQVYLYLRDGSSGSGTILWSAAVSIPAVAGSMSGVSISDIWIPGTANTAMTLEFSAAGGANTVETVSMTGTIVAE